MMLSVASLNPDLFIQKSSDMVAFAFYLFVARSSGKIFVGCTWFALANVVTLQGAVSQHRSYVFVTRPCSCLSPTHGSP